MGRRQAILRLCAPPCQSTLHPANGEHFRLNVGSTASHAVDCNTPRVGTTWKFVSRQGSSALAFDCRRPRPCLGWWSRSVNSPLFGSGPRSTNAIRPSDQPHLGLDVRLSIPTLWITVRMPMESKHESELESMSLLSTRRWATMVCARTLPIAIFCSSTAPKKRQVSPPCSIGDSLGQGGTNGTNI